MLLLLVMFINQIHLKSMLLNEVLTLMVLIACKKMMNLMDNTVRFLRAVTVL